MSRIIVDCRGIDIEAARNEFGEFHPVVRQLEIMDIADEKGAPIFKGDGYVSVNEVNSFYGDIRTYARYLNTNFGVKLYEAEGVRIYGIPAECHKDSESPTPPRLSQATSIAQEIPMVEDDMTCKVKVGGTYAYYHGERKVTHPVTKLSQDGAYVFVKHANGVRRVDNQDLFCLEGLKGKLNLPDDWIFFTDTQRAEKQLEALAAIYLLFAQAGRIRAGYADYGLYDEGGNPQFEIGSVHNARPDIFGFSIYAPGAIMKKDRTLVLGHESGFGSDYLIKAQQDGSYEAQIRLDDGSKNGKIVRIQSQSGSLKELYKLVSAFADQATKKEKL